MTKITSGIIRSGRQIVGAHDRNNFASAEILGAKSIALTVADEKTGDLRLAGFQRYAITMSCGTGQNRLGQFRKFRAIVF